MIFNTISGSSRWAPVTSIGGNEIACIFEAMQSFSGDIKKGR